MREDRSSNDEPGAAYAERQRALRAGEDADSSDEFATPGRWNPADVPQHVRDDVARAPRGEPPF